ncbi:hypothetical protein [Pseudomonas putida]|uniref:hypothetical protein n=1 Tax=Pseudomonas putida TaxID=303 RepID=UPI000A54AF22|nr:hypothetical protein [Pseudomonas putida]MCE0972864.1 hypothetical protein [Pseudomonas putida]MDD2119542.1 hypothetical protein [Pseudomonas putida]UPU90438.1 hypothetical protein M0766_16055 [Pseudomonas putida]HDS1729099.1 hypothetical protein [Pseudomonas putida]
MNPGQTIFPYLLITKHKEVGYLCGVVSTDGSFQHNDGELFTFLTEKPFKELLREFDTAGKEYALVEVGNYAYSNAHGRLARIFMHLD